jgi:hypothetical protein
LSALSVAAAADPIPESPVTEPAVRYGTLMILFTVTEPFVLVYFPVSTTRGLETDGAMYVAVPETKVPAGPALEDELKVAGAALNAPVELSTNVMFRLYVPTWPCVTLFGPVRTPLRGAG